MRSASTSSRCDSVDTRNRSGGSLTWGAVLVGGGEHRFPTLEVERVIGAYACCLVQVLQRTPNHTTPHHTTPHRTARHNIARVRAHPLHVVHFRGVLRRRMCRRVWHVCGRAHRPILRCAVLCCELCCAVLRCAQKYSCGFNSLTPFIPLNFAGVLYITRYSASAFVCARA